MPSTTVLTASIFVLITSALAGYIYIFGIPPEMKKKLEESALKTMGEVRSSHPFALIHSR
jgi:hypothetical protein